MTVPHRSAFAATALAAACSWSQAQTIDQFEVRRDGANAVLQLRFATEIQFRNSVSTKSGDLTLIFYALLTTTNSSWRGSQSLRFGAAQGLPGLDVTDDFDSGERNRKLVLRTAESARVDVRAGAGNRSIEIVFKGLGASVAAAQGKNPRRTTLPAQPGPAVTPEAAATSVTPATLPQNERRFLIVLQSTPEPNVDLPARIPRDLQEYDLFTAERVVDGTRRYEVQLGHFASRTQAEAVLRRLNAFPQARIVANGENSVAPPAVAAAPAAPTPPRVAAAAPPVAVVPVPGPVPVPVPVPTPAPAPAPVPAPAPPRAAAAPPAPAPVPTTPAPQAPTAVADATPAPTPPTSPSVPQAAPPAAPAVSAAPEATAPPPAPTSTPAPAPATAPAPTATAAPEAPVASADDIDSRASALLAAAQAALAIQNPAGALVRLNELLNLPPNRHTRAAQELAGLARLRTGDTARARIEFETYLQLYPTGEGSDRVRRELAALPSSAPKPAPAQAPSDSLPGEAETTLTGSVSTSYFGGNGQVRSQEFKDSPIAGLPQVAGDPLFSPDKSKQWLNDVDLNWRRRDAQSDLRLVFRDSYLSDLVRTDKNKNRLSSMYADYKSLTNGYGVRLGRQSPLGGGVMGRFDGVSANVLLRPKLKLGGVVGVPTDKYFESKRKFYGASIDAESILPNFGAAAFLIQQTIDNQVDRRAIGVDLRYFKGGASVFSQLDYDLLFKGLNVATIQGTLVVDETTVYNALYDRRALTLLTLGNALTFSAPVVAGAPAQPPATRISERLAGTSVAELRDQIKRTTPFITQAQLGVTRPITKTWQFGLSAQLTNTGAIPPVPEVDGFQTGRPATGNIVTVSGQMIGVNLYSERDTHVFSTSYISGTDLTGYLLSYNNSSVYATDWQFEPSLQFYTDRTLLGSSSTRWTPGLRVTYRGWQRFALESSITYEIGRATRNSQDASPVPVTTTTREKSNRANYSFGARYEF